MSQPGPSVRPAPAPAATASVLLALSVAAGAAAYDFTGDWRTGVAVAAGLAAMVVAAWGRVLERQVLTAIVVIGCVVGALISVPADWSTVMFLVTLIGSSLLGYVLAGWVLADLRFVTWGLIGAGAAWWLGFPWWQATAVGVAAGCLRWAGGGMGAAVATAVGGGAALCLAVIALVPGGFAPYVAAVVGGSGIAWQWVPGPVRIGDRLRRGLVAGSVVLYLVPIVLLSMIGESSWYGVVSGFSLAGLQLPVDLMSVAGLVALVVARGMWVVEPEWAPWLLAVVGGTAVGAVAVIGVAGWILWPVGPGTLLVLAGAMDGFLLVTGGRETWTKYVTPAAGDEGEAADDGEQVDEEQPQPVEQEDDSDRENQTA